MAGVGPPPKDRDKRARRNKDVIALRVIEREPEEQPELPHLLFTTKDGDVVPMEWHPQVILWWHIWGRSELSADFTAVEWHYMAETALLMHKFWNGNDGVAAELRLRAAKFGATPEDRARLRIQVVTAQKAEDEVARPEGGSSRDRYRPPQAG